MSESICCCGDRCKKKKERKITETFHRNSPNVFSGAHLLRWDVSGCFQGCFWEKRVQNLLPVATATAPGRGEQEPPVLLCAVCLIQFLQFLCSLWEPRPIISVEVALHYRLLSAGFQRRANDLLFISLEITVRKCRVPTWLWVFSSFLFFFTY